MLLYSFFFDRGGVIPRRFNSCSDVSEQFHIHRWQSRNGQCSKTSTHKFRRWGITPQKEYIIQNAAKF